MDSKFVYMNELYIFGVHTYNKFAKWYRVSTFLNPTFYILSHYM
jgi:hypothetical protein